MFTFQLLAFLAVVFAAAAYALFTDRTEENGKDESVDIRYSDDPHELLMRLYSGLAKAESKLEEKRERTSAEAVR